MISEWYAENLPIIVNIVGTIGITAGILTIIGFFIYNERKGKK